VKQTTRFSPLDRPPEAEIKSFTMRKEGAIAALDPNDGALESNLERF
jgi:hypothetical protein